MKVLFLGTLFWVLAFTIHFIVWKICLPKRQTRTLLFIFLGVLFSGCVLFWLEPVLLMDVNLGFEDHMGIVHRSHLVYMAIYFTSLTLAYMITYSALEADSPSLVMILQVANAGEAGLPKSVFHEHMNDALLVDPRLRDLVKDQMVIPEGEGYRLTAKGRAMALLFIGYRKLLKLEKGG